MSKCITPFVTKDGVSVPCGKCPPCLQRFISNWSFRLMQELKHATSAENLTLTYDTAKVPIVNGQMSLCKRDVQLFLKRLRKAHGKSKIKYFVVGEYGSRLQRPHYHMILFNAEIELIQPAWNNGHVHYGYDVSENAIQYIMKYIMKHQKAGKRLDDKRIPEFRLMSKGLGVSYVQNAKIFSWHRADVLNRMYCNLKDGRKIAMPKYYKQFIYSDAEREEIAANYLLKGYSGKQMDLELKYESVLDDDIILARFIKMWGNAVATRKRF